MDNFRRVLNQVLDLLPGRRPQLEDVFPMMPLYQRFLIEENEWVQVTNENFFENFTVLSWRRENKKLQKIRLEESAKDGPPPTESAALPGTIYEIDRNLWENLYIEVLYTIRHKLGVNSAKNGEFTSYLYEYARQTFNMSKEQHVYFVNLAAEEKNPISVLNVNVVEARNLEAKDPNGFSNPYCMLGIQGTDDKKLVNVSDPEEGTSSAFRGLKKFGASFKRKPSKHHREPDMIPARLIMTTTVKKQTTSPKWREKFRLDIEDAQLDVFHLDVWDNDDESSVTETTRRLNDVATDKGVGRYFKEIAHSNRSNSGDHCDDFLGCVNIPLDLVTSRGIDQWFPLGPRSNRTFASGEIRLKLQLGTREDRGLPTGNDNEREVLEHTQLIWVMVTHELQAFKGYPYQWAGDLPQEALAILHQHALQGDITEFQQAVCQWVSYYRKHQEVVLDYSLMYQHLEEVHVVFEKEEEALSFDAEESLSESFTGFIDHCLYLIRNLRTQFPSHNIVAKHKLKFMLKCLRFLFTMRAFRQLFPFHNELRVDVARALKKGTIQWLQEMRGSPTAVGSIRDFIDFIETLNHELHKSRNFYQLMFEIVDVNFCTIVYRQMSRWLFQEIKAKIGESAFENVGHTPYYLSRHHHDQIRIFLSNLSALETFELFLVLQEFRCFNSCLSKDERSSMALTYSYTWFEGALMDWFVGASSKIRGRIYFALEHDRDLYNQIPEVAIDLDREVFRINIERRSPDRSMNSSSAVEALQSFRNLIEFWNQLMWPDNYTANSYILCIVKATAAGIVLYSNLLWKRLRDDPTCWTPRGYLLLTWKVILFMNNFEYILGGLIGLEVDLKVASIMEAISQKDHITTGEQYRAKIRSVISESQEHVLMMIGCLVKSVVFHMETRLRNLVFHLANGPENIEPRQAIHPLLVYLTKIFRVLKIAFLPMTFQEVIHGVWLRLLQEFATISSSNLTVSNEEKQIFFHHLYVCLQILLDFYLGDDAGLPLEKLQCPVYRALEREIWMEQCETTVLIEYYYSTRIEEQIHSREAPLGYIKVKAVYDQEKESLFAQVISARGLLPCDTNGSSDPFVYVILVPQHLFPKVELKKTSTHMKTLNPTFMESFEWSISPEQLRHQATAINFVVMDYDYMRKDDFEGEAYYPLSNVPNVSDEAKKMPDHMELILTCPNQKSDILMALDRRIKDHEAQTVVDAEKGKT